MTINDILNESYNVFAENITNKILNFLGNNKPRKIGIGHYFGKDYKTNDITIGFYDKDENAKEAVVWFQKTPYPSLPYHILINRQALDIHSTLNHEVNHILNFIRSKGKTVTNKKAPSKMKKYLSKNKDDEWDHDYLNNSDELNSFYNQFVYVLKGKKFKTTKEVIREIAEHFKEEGVDNVLYYYFVENKETAKYFRKKLYKDGVLEQ